MTLELPKPSLRNMCAPRKAQFTSLVVRIFRFSRGHLLKS